MFYRTAISHLKVWASKKNRKPLIIRGARQVGKTTIVDMFSKEFDQYIYLNLDKPEELKLFENDYSFQELLMTLFLYANKKRNNGKTLIFIDEIQNSANAVRLLRYFYEEASDLFVVAAGSLLETLIDKKISFPVGRVEYLAMRPCSFKEFLIACKEEESLSLIESFDVPEYAHDKLSSLFHQYVIIGGMPEIVNQYTQAKDISSLNDIYDALITSYLDDVEKYASNESMVQYLRHIINTAFYEAGSRVTFEKFGNSPYRSREMKEAFLNLQKTMLLNLVYPTNSTVLPMQPNLKLKPRLHLLDTGLVNYFSGVQVELMQNKNISDMYRGKIAEHITGQELLTLSNSIQSKLNFWTREKASSSAEIDYLHIFGENIIPIEIKSGAIGRLRSLHQFIDQSDNNIAIRFWTGKKSIEQARTLTGKPFTLLNLPFYMIARINNELEKIL